MAVAICSACPMRYHKFWIEIVVLGTAVAFVLALLLASLGAAASAASGEHESAAASAQQAFEGMITCSKCGAKHSASLDHSASNCVRICVHAGADFALVDDNGLYFLDGDRVALKKVAGQRARITGVLNGRTIKVASASSGS